MKSILFYLSFIFILFSSSLCHSQILFGPKIGLNNAWADTDNRNIGYTQGEHINRIQFGFVYDHAIKTQFSIRAEVLYSEKGYAVRKYYNSYLFDVKNTQNSSYWELQKRYLEVPVMLKWFTESRSFKFYINAGIYGAYWLSANNYASLFTYNLGDISPKRKEAEQEYEFDNDFGTNKRKDNRIDYGLVAGSGLAYKIKRGEIFIEARYSHGFADRFVFEASQPKYYLPQMNRNWSFSAGFLLTLKPKKIHKKIEENEPEEEEQSE